MGAEKSTLQPLCLFGAYRFFQIIALHGREGRTVNFHETLHALFHLLAFPQFFFKLAFQLFHGIAELDFKIFFFFFQFVEQPGFAPAPSGM